jgi:hypothetical protein
MFYRCSILLIACVSLFSLPAIGQVDVINFDVTSEGPWSDVEATTITIPKVNSGQVNLNGDVSSAEYGGFQGITVNPGENAWILDYAHQKNWEGPEDSSFTFYLAYDDDFLYVGVDVKDDVIRSNDPPAAFWKDDAVEIIVEPLNTRFDSNIDSTNNFFGGHCYFNWEGAFSEWENGERRDAVRWASLADWAYGEDAEVFAVGKQTSTGYVVEIKMHKVMFVDPVEDFQWQEGQDMAFNIGLDDDDGADLALQYFWANRVRAKGFNQDTMWDWTDEEIANRDYLNPDITWYTLGVDAGGRLTSGGAGEIILGPMGTTQVQEWSLF